MRLEAHHLIAINYLALPRRGGLTMQQIADEAQVSRQTVYDWLDNPVFAAELKKRMIRNTRDAMPNMINEAMKGVTEDRNAAMFKLFLEMNDMLANDINVGDKLDEAGDLDAVKARIAEFERRGKKKEE